MTLALIIMRRALRWLEANKDTAYLCHYMRNYASNLMRSEKVEKSNALIRRVWELMPVYREKMAVTHAILVENFLYLRQLDSAAYYLDMAWQAGSESRAAVRCEHQYTPFAL